MSFSDEADSLFYFESDHLALKGNKDYSEVLKTIFILDSQRAKAIKDYDTVVELQNEALKDPLAFIEQLRGSKEIGVPELQIIADVPNIQWSKFKINLPEEAVKFINEKFNSPNETINLIKEEKTLRDNADTHNKAWTTEEQKRLEELLVVFPPEPIEFRRFKKIAAALGNRTVKQVSSRVQKYFLKLYRAGLPIPGRIPKYAERIKKSKLHVHQRHNHYLFKPSTFFPALDIPVVMNDSEPVPGPSTHSTNNPTLVNYLIPQPLEPTESRKSCEEPANTIDIQLNILHRVKYEKQKGHSNFQHIGYKCNYCNDEPITGVRWHCKMCVTNLVDFCTDCVIGQMYSEKPHPLSHKLEVIRDNASESGFQSDNSSNESTSGSAFDSSNKNFESSNNSSDSDIEDEDDADELSSYNDIKEEDMELDYECVNKEIKTETMETSDIFSSSYVKDPLLPHSNSNEKSEFEVDAESVLENSGYVKTTSGFSKTDTTYDDDKYSDNLVSDVVSVSYNYLHSNLLLDST
ncbi:hypothetical protein FQA39_LY04029 [Lamprigera yunnana]|nr:hypothetical protein FQA39_LY04029 [Lamprigera yunnana]